MTRKPSDIVLRHVVQVRLDAFQMEMTNITTRRARNKKLRGERRTIAGRSRLLATKRGDVGGGRAVMSGS